jgi:hypothetical protein
MPGYTDNNAAITRLSQKKTNQCSLAESIGWGKIGGYNKQNKR